MALETAHCGRQRRLSATRSSCVRTLIAASEMPRPRRSAVGAWGPTASFPVGHVARAIRHRQRFMRSATPRSQLRTHGSDLDGEYSRRCFNATSACTIFSSPRLISA
jgi:hypothetical protein